MDFQKIKFELGTETKAPQVLLKYEQRTEGGGSETHRLKCDDLPRPELRAALSALKPVVMSACLLPDAGAGRRVYRQPPPRALRDHQTGGGPALGGHHGAARDGLDQ